MRSEPRHMPPPLSFALGALALAAVAAGAVAIGYLAIGRLSIRRARLRRLEIDNLIVHRLYEPHPRPRTAETDNEDPWEHYSDVLG